MRGLRGVMDQSDACTHASKCVPTDAAFRRGYRAAIDAVVRILDHEIDDANESLRKRRDSAPTLDYLEVVSNVLGDLADRIEAMKATHSPSGSEKGTSEE
jgi:hypothetical protein